MPQSFTITSEDKSRRTLKSFVTGDLHLTKNVFFPGYWYITQFDASVSTSDMTSRHLLVSGRVIETTGVIADRIPGWVSTDDDAIIPAGSYRRESPLGAEMWCIRKLGDLHGRVDHVQIAALQPGEKVAVTVGQSLFIAEGVCSAGGHELAQEKYFRVSGGDKEITAQSRAFLIIWTQPVADD